MLWCLKEVSGGGVLLGVVRASVGCQYTITPNFKKNKTKQNTISCSLSCSLSSSLSLPPPHTAHLPRPLVAEARHRPRPPHSLLRPPPTLLVLPLLHHVQQDVEQLPRDMLLHRLAHSGLRPHDGKRQPEGE